MYYFRAFWLLSAFILSMGTSHVIAQAPTTLPEPDADQLMREMDKAILEANSADLMQKWENAKALGLQKRDELLNAMHGNLKAIKKSGSEAVSVGKDFVKEHGKEHLDAVAELYRYYVWQTFLAFVETAASTDTDAYKRILAALVTGGMVVGHVAAVTAAGSAAVAATSWAAFTATPAVLSFLVFKFWKLGIVAGTAYAVGTPVAKAYYNPIPDVSYLAEKDLKQKFQHSVYVTCAYDSHDVVYALNEKNQYVQIDLGRWGHDGNSWFLAISAENYEPLLKSCVSTVARHFGRSLTADDLKKLSIGASDNWAKAYNPNFGIYPLQLYAPVVDLRTKDSKLEQVYERVGDVLEKDVK